jgi:hypothetical protein
MCGSRLPAASRKEPATRRQNLFVQYIDCRHVATFLPSLMTAPPYDVCFRSETGSHCLRSLGGVYDSIVRT